MPFITFCDVLQQVIDRSRGKKTMADLKGTSNFCARYSVAGILFMMMIIMMLTYQPFYVGGIEDLERAKKNAYGGVGTFLFIFMLSVVYLVIDALRGDSREINSLGPMNSSRNNNDTRYSGGINGDYEGIPAMSNNSMMAGSDNYELPPSVEQAHFT